MKRRISSFSLLGISGLLMLSVMTMTTTTNQAYAQQSNEKIYKFCWFDPNRPTATGCIFEFGKKSCESELARLEPANPQFVYDDKCTKVKEA